MPLEPAAAAAGGDEDEDFDEPQPANLPHHTFGSVWDSQIGLPTSGSPAVDSLSGGMSEEEDLEEPEVPEYLLAERRQRGARQGGRAGVRPARGRSAYQAALDRERFGNRGAPQPSFGGTSTRTPGGNRDRGRGGRPMGQGGSRPPRAPRMDDRPRYDEARSSTEPWSEVPPELEEMLRAELSRKAPAASAGETPVSETMVSETRVIEVPISELPSPIASFGATTPADAPAEAKPPRRTRTTKAKSADEAATAATSGEAGAAAAQSTRSRTTKATTARTTTTRSRKAAPTADGEAAPKKPATRRKTAAAAEPPAESTSEATEG